LCTGAATRGEEKVSKHIAKIIKTGSRLRELEFKVMSTFPDETQNHAM